MQRLNFFEKAQKAMTPFFMLGAHLRRSELGSTLLELVNFRVSQINGCAYCLDTHSKDLRAAGEDEQRLHMMAAWHEASCYSARERAALLWAEALTNLNDGRVSDDVYAIAREHFSDGELVDLTLAVLTINSYNRLNVAFRTPAGGYVVGEHEVLLEK